MIVATPFSMRALVVLVGWYTASAVAQSISAPPLETVERIQAAARTLTFSGTFVHQQDSSLHTSRIAQLRDGKQTITRVQAMEGHRLEVVKTADETRIYLPDRQMIKVEKVAQPRAEFPAMFVGSAATVLRNYDVVPGNSMRVANVDAQELLFKPKHESRWSVRVWVDKRTSLVVKCQKLDATGNAVEQASFTELAWARPALALSLSPSPDAKSWSEFDATMQRVNGAAPLVFKSDTLKGFEPIGVYERRATDQLDMRRYVFSDGIAMVSVFVQPKPAKHPLFERAKRRGATTFVSREIQEAWVTAMGDVPADTLQQFIQTIEWK